MSTDAAVLSPGEVVWALFDPVRGREQGGHRPAVVISSAGYLNAVDTLAFVVPVTTVARGWPNHVRLAGENSLERPSWAMTEQLRALSRDRITGSAGSVTSACLAEIRQWIADFLDLEPAAG